MKVEGAVALVTGANRGLGRACTRALLDAGAAKVYAGVRDPATVTDPDVVPLRLDVTDPAQVEAAAREASDVTIVINNAGIAMTRPALEISEDEWTGLIDVNLNGAWRVAQCAARHFQRHGRPGAIVNIASILGQRVASHVAAYTAAKAGLLHLTRALALEWARHGIRVNALAPGYIGTDLNREFFATPAGEALVKRIPQRRLGTPQDLDGPLLLLASDASAYMTGAVIDVDGGHLASSL